MFFDGPVALYICYLISKGSPKVNFWMIVLATAELYGGESQNVWKFCFY